MSLTNSNYFQSLHKHTYKTQGKCDTCRKYAYPLKSEDNALFRCRKCIENGVGLSTASVDEAVSSLLSIVI